MKGNPLQLSAESEIIVNATAGIVGEHAEDITNVFYSTIFAAHPELLNVFNTANQADGEQPKALAASVVAFAMQLLDPNSPDFTPVMRRISHRHASLGIKARQYTIVGRILTDAIATVLGAAITTRVRAAWDEVYWLFATELISQEAKFYALSGTDPEQPWRKYRVVERFEESANIISLVIAPVENTVPPHRTGQYVSVSPLLPNGARQPRPYTISSGPRNDSLRISIKRVLGERGRPDGIVSNWLHDNAQPGTMLDVSQPSGDVVLDETNDPLVLVSAGIGITPMSAILEDLARRQPDRTVRLFHSDHTHQTQALYGALQRQMLAMSDARAQIWYTPDGSEASAAQPELSGKMDLSAVELPQNATVFMCGPLPFMQSMRAMLLRRGVANDRIHYEVFGPDLWAQDPETHAAG